MFAAPAIVRHAAGAEQGRRDAVAHRSGDRHQHRHDSHGYRTARGGSHRRWPHRRGQQLRRAAGRQLAQRHRPAARARNARAWISVICAGRMDSPTSGQYVYFTAEDAQQVGAARHRQRARWTGASRPASSARTWWWPAATAACCSPPTSGSGTVSIIDAAARWQRDADPGGTSARAPEGWTSTPDGRQLWTANSEGGSVSIVDVATQEAGEDFRHRHAALEPAEVHAGRHAGAGVRPQRRRAGGRGR